MLFSGCERIFQLSANHGISSVPQYEPRTAWLLALASMEVRIFLYGLRLAADRVCR
jgi:hypothetical protein